MSDVSLSMDGAVRLGFWIHRSKWSHQSDGMEPLFR